MKAELIRIEVGLQGSFGTWLFDDKAFCVTLELPSRKNQRQVSSIPVGKYTCIRRPSPLITRLTQGKWKTGFEITGVPNRSAIMVHSGRSIKHTLGCVLVASSYGKLKAIDREVLNSGQTFLDFMEYTKDVNQFELEVREVDLTPQYPAN
jgi:hypothetical protein